MEERGPVAPKRPGCTFPMRSHEHQIIKEADG